MADVSSPPAFVLRYCLGTGEPEQQASVCGDSEAELMDLVKSSIAEGLGRPELIVTLDSRGRFTLGAGFWSRSGLYHLEPRAAASLASPHQPYRAR